jgi:hypothetical protein
MITIKLTKIGVQAMNKTIKEEGTCECCNKSRVEWSKFEEDNHEEIDMLYEEFVLPIKRNLTGHSIKVKKKEIMNDFLCFFAGAIDAGFIDIVPTKSFKGLVKRMLHKKDKFETLYAEAAVTKKSKEYMKQLNQTDKFFQDLGWVDSDGVFTDKTPSWVYSKSMKNPFY